MIILKLKFNYENNGLSRTHYTTEYKEKKYNIVIIHNKDFDEICTATKDGEPSAPLKENIKVIIKNNTYITKRINNYTTIIKESEK